ncbi:MAG: hypothetical protein CMM08_19310 [Rhodospirillaceae bacterium]|jgi:2-methylfumaryl-CoA hydratase|nr:hypothetical protein [Rhodospirillaceae bacterium]MDP6624695.1 MaoC family dehydratase [Alphaproteobacteria bacterium]|tara:strand:- start:507 stop:1559 length:1053 start_codon:yes stop_codon:yes gene_type:complete
MQKTSAGNFFEDFALEQKLRHATPRTLSAGDVSLYTALYGSRFAVNSAEPFAQSLGFKQAPVDDFLTFHVVFGKTVPDVSLNAVANLGYAEGRFLAPVYVGDTLTTSTTVIGLKQNSNGKTGTVYVRSVGVNQRDEPVIDYVRWMMVNKRDPGSAAPEASVPDLSDHVSSQNLWVPEGLRMAGYDTALAGSPHLWDDFVLGERIDHVDGITVEEAEHMMATRLYQNTARVHFNQLAQQDSRFGRRLIYGGHVISLARALSFNGLANSFRIAAINGGRHVAPLFAGDTVFAWSEVLDKAEISGHHDVGALRLRTLATKDQPCAEFPDRDAESKFLPAVILELDYWVLMPRR